MTTTDRKGGHLHGLTETDKQLAALDARLKKLEAPTTPPPVEPPPDTRPTISGLAVSAVTQTEARVSWSLSEPSTGQIEYGKTTSYGTWSTLEPRLLPSHSQVLAGLATDTTYHFRVHSKDSAGQEVISADTAFKTQAATTTPPPIEPPPAGATRVTSVPDLLAAARNTTIRDIVVANGTYAVSAAAFDNADSLSIDAVYSNRPSSAALTIRAETRYGVTFNGGGTANGLINFNYGACYQTWDGFVFAGARISSTGVLTTGGYGGAAPHDITLKFCRFAATNVGTNAGALDHCIYGGSNGAYSFTFEDIDFDCTGGLATGLHLYAHDVNGPKTWTLRRSTIKGAMQAIMLWDTTLQNIVIEDVQISDARDHALSYHHAASGSKILRRVTSVRTKSGAPRDVPDSTGLTEESCSWA